jgi:hypothetical protein
MNEMSLIEVIRQKILALHLRVVCIQKACKQRKLSFRNRIAFLKVYWQRMKLEMQNMLMANKDYALKLISMPDSARDHIIQQYAKYTIDRFTVNFIQFRMNAADYRGKEYQLADEKPVYEEKVKALEAELFENLDPVFEECVTRNKVTFIRASQEGERPRSENSDYSDLPICPPFTFMPTRPQMMRMIAKAAEYADT